jgi:hypothetical protein
MFSKLMDPTTAKPTHTTTPPPQAAAAPMTQLVQPTTDAPTLANPQTTAKPPTKRKQVSAYLSAEQVHLLKQLYFQFNSGDTTVEKSEIIGLSLELLAELLRTQVLAYASIQQFRQQIRSNIAKYLRTQAANHPST